MTEEKSTEQVEEKIEAKKVEPPKAKPKYWLPGLSVAVVLLAASTGVLAWQFFEKSDANKQQSAQISGLQEELQDVQKDLAKLKNKAGGADITPTPTPTVSVTLKDNVAAAIETMNTAALEGYMADSVYVIYAATEYAGDRTPAQAVADLDYLSSATGPWDFDLPAATLQAYQGGYYSDYFGDYDYYISEDEHPHIVGQSSDGYVVSFCIDEDGNINGVFITGSSELLI